MSKALYVYRGGPDPRTLAELAMLRSRIRELEAEVALLRSGAPTVAAEELDLLVADPAMA